jgi:osmotically-inducible protein OsmY
MSERRTPGHLEDHYLVERVRHRLAHDERVNELELDVSIRGDRVVVTGSVSTEERRAAVTAVVAETVGDRTVQNETTVLPRRSGGEVETIS